eukprot:m51a1_g8963 hypothetical protein (289) ;mRNA; f:1064655-1065521
MAEPPPSPARSRAPAGAPADPYSRLCAACAAGNVPLAARLLSAGVPASVDCADPRDPAEVARHDTPLCAALRAGADESARLLLECGASCEHLGRSPSLRGVCTPLGVCADAGNLAGARALLDAGADPNAETLLTDYNDGCTSPLYVAAVQGRAAMLRALADRGATVGANRALRAVCAAPEGTRGVVQALLDAGADPDAASRGCSALEVAAEYAAPDVVALLLARGADPNSRGHRGTPLQRACRRRVGAWVVAGLLVRSGAVLCERDAAALPSGLAAYLRGLRNDNSGP